MLYRITSGYEYSDHEIEVVLTETVGDIPAKMFAASSRIMSSTTFPPPSWSFLSNKMVEKQGVASPASYPSPKFRINAEGEVNLDVLVLP